MALTRLQIAGEAKSIECRLGSDAGIDYLASILGLPIRKGPIYPGGPTLHQCIGSQRLWGAALGTAYCVHSEKLELQDQYEKVSLLTRSYLVIQDFLIDETYSESTKALSNLHLDLILSHLLQNASIAKLPVDTIKQRICSAKTTLSLDNHDNKRIFDPSHQCKKWSSLFFPFSIHINYQSSTETDTVIKFLDDFFEVCQVLDDFHDIEYDSKKTSHINLFSSGLDENETSSLINNKIYISIFVIEYALYKMNAYKNIFSDENHIINNYIERSISWLKSIRYSNIDKYTFPDIWRAMPTNINLSDLTHWLSQNHISAVKIDLDIIRPEFLQTDQIPYQELS